MRHACFRTLGSTWLLWYLVVLPVRAADFTWIAQSQGSWSTGSNWSPAGGPKTASDRGIFNASGTGNCTSILPVNIGALEMRAGYLGTISGFSMQFNQLMVGAGNLLAARCTDATTTGGLVGSLTCSRDVQYTSGTVANLVFTGEGTFSGSNGMALLSLENRSGTHTQKNLFEAASFTISGGTYVTDTLAALVGGVVNVNAAGRLVLHTGSGVASLGAMNIAGTVDARAPGVAMSAAGDWTCTGQYLTSGTLLNQLVLLQANGGVVDHGSNRADNVIIRGASNQSTRWTSSNTLVGLQVLSDSTLQVDSDAVVSVTGVMANLGHVVEVPPAHVHVLSTVALTVSGDALASQVLVNQGLVVGLSDADENLDGTAFDSVGAELVNPRNGDHVAATLIESGSTATGVFSNANDPVIVVWGGSAIEDNKLQALPGDTLEARYQDAEDALDSASDSIDVGEAGFPTPTVTPTPTATNTPTATASPTATRTPTPGPVKEWLWLERGLPASATAGGAFDVVLSLRGGPASITAASETFPAGWQLLGATPMYQRIEDHTMYLNVAYPNITYRIRSATDASGTYHFTGSTVSYHSATGFTYYSVITGDSSIDVVLPPPSADFNHDGKVDELDLAMLVENLASAAPAYDLDRSGVLDAADVFLFSMFWKTP